MYIVVNFEKALKGFQAFSNMKPEVFDEPQSYFGLSVLMPSGPLKPTQYLTKSKAKIFSTIKEAEQMLQYAKQSYVHNSNFRIIEI